MGNDEKISEFIGIAADLVVALHGGSIQQSDFVSVFHITGVENPSGEDHTRADGLIRKAYIYHSVNKNTNTASNIETVFRCKDGKPIVR
jgi:hypothetical protein